jgi:hypothetical protein
VGGTARLTADGVIGTSGKPIRITSIVVHSAGTGGVVQLRNGTSGTDTEFDEINGTANVSKRVEYEGGLFLPDGGYYDEDANVVYSVINYEQVQS